MHQYRDNVGRAAAQTSHEQAGGIVVTYQRLRTTGLNLRLHLAI